MTESPRSRCRLPHWGWFLLATVVLVVGFVGLSVWLPYYREQQVMNKVKIWKGFVETESWYETETAGPEWLRRLVGEDRMVEFKVFQRVVHVELHSSAITDAEIVHLSGLTRLKEILLNDTAITDASLVHISRLTNLERLGLGHTAITDAGLVHISRLTNLERLDLWGTMVTSDGLPHLNGLTNLIELDLTSTRVTDAGLPHLRGLTNLRTLILFGSWGVTDKGVEELQKALPDCEIER